MFRSLGFLPAIFLSLPVVAQTSFTIKGQLGKLQAPAKVYIGFSVEGKSVYDSADISNGFFQLTQDVPYPVNAMLSVSRTGESSTVFDSKSVARLYVEPGVTIWLTSDENIAGFEATGSQSQLDYKVYQRYMAPADAKLNAITSQSSATTGATAQAMAARKEHFDKMRTAMNERRELMKRFIAEHSNMEICLDILEEYGGHFIDYRDVEPMFKALHESVRETTRGKMLEKKINDAKATAVGKAAPEFALKDTEGNKVTLSSFKGKYVLLNFWSSLSGASRGENAQLRDLLKSFKDNSKLVVVGVGLEERKEEWKKAIQEDGMYWLQVSDLNYMKSEVALQYGITVLPQNVLIDPAGNIVARNLKGQNLEEKLKEVLQ
jgi:peroxiredoxin